MKLDDATLSAIDRGSISRRVVRSPPENDSARPPIVSSLIVKAKIDVVSHVILATLYF